MADTPHTPESTPDQEKFQAFADFVKESARAIGRDFTKPDDDWSPALILLKEGDNIVVALHELFRSPETKRLIPEAFKNLFGQVQPELAAMVVSAWQTRILKDDPLAGLSHEMNRVFGVSNHPQREEILMVLVANPERTELWAATITRPKNEAGEGLPPVLGEWELSEISEGRMVEAVQGAFAHMKSAGTKKARRKKW